MRLALVMGVVGQLLRLFSLAFLPPIALALFDGIEDPASLVVAGNFALALGATVAGGFLLAWGYKPAPTQIRRSEALGVVALTWMIVGHFAALPYILEGIHPVDALFESISGFTTTGATILTDWDHTRAFYLWRAMTQWFGGLGVIALFIVVLPRLGIAGRQLFFAEASGTVGDPIAPQIRQVALRLWVVYLGLTAAQTLLLTAVAGMPLFESVCHSLTTLAAGGFSPNPSSIEGYRGWTESVPGWAGYDAAASEWIFVVFMLLSGTSFVLQWRAFSRVRPMEFLRDEEFRFYAGSCALAAVGVAFLLAEGLPNLDLLRDGAFQAASLISSTGFASTDYDQWGDYVKVLLVIVMVIGGCAGSAAGGAKAIRHLLVFKFLRREVTQVLHPQAVLPLKYNRRAIPPEIMRAVFTLVVLYLAGYLVIAALVVLLEGEPDGFVTGFSASLACLGNIGPGFKQVGPMLSYAELSAPTKVVLTLAMWIGRLEIVTVLALLHSDVWRRLRWAAAPRQRAD